MMIIGRGIQTRYLGPTNFRGSRVVAEWTDQYDGMENRRVTVDYDDGADPRDAHRRGAVALLEAEKVHRADTPAPMDPAFRLSDWSIGTTKGYIFAIVRD